MANGDGLDKVEEALLNHTAKDEDTQMLMKGVLAIVQSQKNLPCKSVSKTVSDNVVAIKKNSDRIMYWSGALAVVGIVIGLLSAYLFNK